MNATTPQPASANFGFLGRHDRELVRLPALAELYCHRDPNTALLKLRQFVERLAELTAARHGIDAGDANLGALVHELSRRGAVHPDVIQSFHYVRALGNQAAHEMRGTTGEAIHALKAARRLGAWYHRTFFERGFKPGPFVARARPHTVGQPRRARCLPGAPYSAGVAKAAPGRTSGSQRR